MFTAASSAASLSQLKHREKRQKTTIWTDNHVLLFFKHHRKLSFTRPGRKAIRFAKAELGWTRREIKETRAILYPPKPHWPPHMALWLCEHNHEGNWSDPNSGGNGHWGGLQMHPGWGYGTSYHANNDSEWVQVWAAEHGYQASGYSKTWLIGQWAHYDCLKFA